LPFFSAIFASDSPFNSPTGSFRPPLHDGAVLEPRLLGVEN
jgi:hypothetical protein